MVNHHLEAPPVDLQFTVHTLLHAVSEHMYELLWTDDHALSSRICTRCFDVHTLRERVHALREWVCLQI